MHVGLRLSLVHEQGGHVIPGDLGAHLDGAGQDVPLDGELTHVLGVDVGGDDDTSVGQPLGPGLGQQHEGGIGCAQRGGDLQALLVLIRQGTGEGRGDGMGRLGLLW